MKTIVLFALATTTLACTEAPLAVFELGSEATGGRASVGELGPSWTVDTATTTRRIRVAAIDRPPVAGATWHVAGRVRYQGVEGTGYLELLNFFPNGVYFTRSLAPMGPLGNLTGSSGWRPYSLPFDASDAPAPTRLELWVVLPGPGAVELGPTAVYDGFVEGAPVDRAWLWLGPALGALGALYGIFGRRRAFRPVGAAVMILLLLGGLTFLGLGIAAVVQGQWVRATTGLIAGPAVCGVVGVMLRQRRREQAAEELRAMQAADA